MLFMLSHICSAQTIIDLIGADESQPLPFKEAFTISASSKDGKAVVNLEVTDGYYLYKDNFKIIATDGIIKDTLWGETTLKDDPYFGMVPVVTSDSFIEISLANTNSTSLQITAQGCSSEGICYMPEHYEFYLEDLKSYDLSNTKPLIFFLTIGLLISLTPCTFPLIPIVIASIGKNKKLNAIAYSQGLAMTFMAVGIVTTVSGSLITPYLNHPYIVSCLSALILLMGILMATDRSPTIGTSLSRHLEESSSKVRSEPLRAFLLGAISGLVATSCTAAPLFSLFAELSILNNLTYSVSALYVTAMGLTLPLITIAVLGQSIILKPGKWMLTIKAFLSTAVICYPIYLLQSHHFLYQTSYSVIAALLLIIFCPKKEKIIGIPILFLSVFFFSTEIDNETALLQTESQLKKGTVIVKIEADWCATCRENKELLKNVDFKEATLLSLDLTEMDEFESQFVKAQKIKGLPRLMVYQDGILVSSVNGRLTQTDISNILENFVQSQ